MHVAPLHLAWTALTCNLEGTDIYFGLTAGQDDLLAYLVSADRLAAFPFQQIAIATGSTEQVPLRVYAVRDPSIVRITPMQGATPEPGFERVRLEFRLAQQALAKDNGTPCAAEAKAGATESPPAASRPVIAFLLTIGLAEAREDEFYRTVVRDFLKRSWMSLPRLLHEIGCSQPAEVAEGACHRCD